MLDILGLIAGNILNLPGILGMALGMTTRNPLVGSLLGAIVGVVSTLVFYGLSFSAADTTELLISVGVGVVFGGLGSLVRRHGATV